ncbi:MAG TPA: DUF2239 family protein [Bryobacteraceae bacterium]|nr:DUF2239 family protein [Bryobacteraceae bacterium]
MSEILCTAFEGSRRIASGELAGVAAKVKQVIDAGAQEPVLIFDDATSAVIEVDFRGTAADVAGRLAERPARPAAEPEPETQRRPGRPKLGVVAREVTLLPRHWEWLNGQPGGASVALRKLVEEARKANEGTDRVRRAREAAYRFMSAMAGNEPGFEEAARALFRGNREAFEAQVEAWPLDVREHAKKLASVSFE